MHTALAELVEELVSLSFSLGNLPNSVKAMNLTYGNWSYPGISPVELSEEVDAIVQFIKDRETDDIGEYEDEIEAFCERISYLTKQTVVQIPNNGAAQAASAIVITLQCLRKLLESVLAGVLQEIADSNARSLRDISTQIRGMESRIVKAKPQVEDLVTMVEKIESAYRAADQLSVTEADLEQAKRDAIRASGEIGTQASKVNTAVSAVDGDVVKITKALSDAESLISQMQQLHRVGTSTALAGAFQARAKELSRQVYYWLMVLIVALVVAILIGIDRAHAIGDALKKDNIQLSVIFIHSWLALLGFGAPVWLGWIATKQISQRFKLSEDYFFKASISNAYEGYRIQAVKIDPSFDKRLLSSALDRLDEIPSRVIETENYGSPAHEVLKSGFWDFLIQVFGRKSLEASDLGSVAAMEKAKASKTEGTD